MSGESPSAGKYFVTDAIHVAGERELVDPVCTIDDATSRLHFLVGQLAGEHWLIKSKREGASWERYREQLVTIAAAAMQTAKQLEIESRQDAIGKDIPY